MYTQVRSKYKVYAWNLQYVINQRCPNKQTESQVVCREVVFWAPTLKQHVAASSYLQEQVAEVLSAKQTRSDTQAPGSPGRAVGVLPWRAGVRKSGKTGRGVWAAAGKGLAGSAMETVSAPRSAAYDSEAKVDRADASHPSMPAWTRHGNPEQLIYGACSLRGALQGGQEHLDMDGENTSLIERASEARSAGGEEAGGGTPVQVTP